MENIQTAPDSTTKFGIQTILILNLGFKTEEHKLIPELLTIEEFEQKTLEYGQYGEYKQMELDCLDEYGVPYTIVINNHLLEGSYFKFLRINVETL